MTNDIIKHYGRKIRDYDATHNEGGEGYNPHQEEHDKAVDAAVAAGDRYLLANAEDIRQRWTAAVNKHTKAGRVNQRDMAKIEAEAGVTLSDVNRLRSLLEK